MLAKPMEAFFARLIGILVHRRETLSEKEKAVQTEVLQKLLYVERKTNESVVVAMVGLDGSGKSLVAEDLAKCIGAVVIEEDIIRIGLHRRHENHKQVRAIVENVVVEIVNRGGNVILRSDYSGVEKRASLRQKARRAGVVPIFIRTTCDFPVAISRMQGNDVKIRKMMQEISLHYHQAVRGGEWMPRKPPFDVLATIDTTDAERRKKEVLACAKQLGARYS